MKAKSIIDAITLIDAAKDALASTPFDGDATIRLMLESAVRNLKAEVSDDEDDTPIKPELTGIPKAARIIDDMETSLRTFRNLAGALRVMAEGCSDNGWLQDGLHGIARGLELNADHAETQREQAWHLVRGSAS